MTSFDGTVVSTVTECGEVNKVTGGCHDNTLRSHSTMIGAQGCSNTSPTGSHVRKFTAKDILRQVMVQEIGWASQVLKLFSCVLLTLWVSHYSFWLHIM